jgi:hypothetical protein
VTRAILCTLILVLASSASAFCRMTTSGRRASSTEPCIFPDPSTSPPEQFLAWTRRCSTIALAVTADPNDDPAAVSHHMSASDVRFALQRSISTWEGVTCENDGPHLTIRILDDQATCSAPIFRDGGTNANTVMFVDDWPMRRYDPAAFAVTTVWHRKSTGEILDVDMEINEARGPYGNCPDTGCSGETRVDLQNVVTHELGHYFGLAHSTDFEATMFASATAGEISKRDLGADDVAGICAIYPPGSLPEACDDTPNGGFGLRECKNGCGIAPRRSGLPMLWWIVPAIVIAGRYASSRARRAVS